VVELTRTVTLSFTRCYSLESVKTDVEVYMKFRKIQLRILQIIGGPAHSGRSHLLIECTDS